MIEYNIPGRKNLRLENLVLDYNGTIAKDGKLLEGVSEKLEELDALDIYILTADTRGTVRQECENLNAKILTFPGENAALEKEKIVKGLGGENTVVLGNGYNDILMFKEAALSIAVIEGEGMAGELILSADIVTTSILAALDILIDSDKIKATLRN